jgi:hypothetical protein
MLVEVKDQTFSLAVKQPDDNVADIWSCSVKDPEHDEIIILRMDNGFVMFPADQFNMSLDHSASPEFGKSAVASWSA